MKISIISFFGINVAQVFSFGEYYTFQQNHILRLKNYPHLLKEWIHLHNVFIENAIPLNKLSLYSNNHSFNSLGDEFARPFIVPKEFTTTPCFKEWLLSSSSSSSSSLKIIKENSKADEFPKEEEEKEQTPIEKRIIEFQRKTLLNESEERLWQYLRIVFIIYMIQRLFM
jgi:hypothetical protein